MSVARAAQDEVDAVRREMQEKLKAAQEYTERQVCDRGSWRQISCLIAGKTKRLLTASDFKVSDDADANYSLKNHTK